MPSRHAQFVLLALMATLLASTAAADPPTFTHLWPMGVQPGQAVQVTVYGTGVNTATDLWTNIPGAKITPPEGDPTKRPASNSIGFTIQVPKETPLGIYGARIVNAGGVSNLRLLMVDDLPTLRESGTHATRETAQEVQLPVAIEGAPEAEASDFYKFHARAGQRVSVDVVARRLGTPLDPVVWLRDARGRELGYADDDESTGADGRFSHRFTEEGDYTLEIRDVRYLGTGQYRYRLRLGDFPLATAPWPLAGVAGSTARLAIAGIEVEGLKPIKFKVPAAEAGMSVPVPVRHSKDGGSSCVRLLATAGPEQVEIEPNDKLETATAIEPVGGLNGRFEQPRDRDYYKFAAKKDQRWLFVGITRSLAAPTDLFLRMYDAQGKQLAEADDTGIEEGTLDFKAPADGNYYLAVDELLHRAGPERVYRIEARPYEPGFSLTVDADKFDAPRGGTCLLKVAAARRDFTGPITLSFAGVDTSDWKITGNVMGEGKTAVNLFVTLPPSTEPGKLLTFTLEGRATIDKKPVVVEASALTPLQTALNGMYLPPSKLDRTLAIGVGPEVEDFLALDGDKPTVNFAQQSGKSQLTVRFKRLGKFDDKVTISVEGLPAGFAAKPVDVNKLKTEGELEITGPLSPALADYQFRVLVTGTYLNQTRSATGEGTLTITPPAPAAAKKK